MILHALQGATEDLQLLFTGLQRVVTTLVPEQGIDKNQLSLFENRVLPKLLSGIRHHGETAKPGVSEDNGDLLLFQQGG